MKLVNEKDVVSKHSVVMKGNEKKIHKCMYLLDAGLAVYSTPRTCMESFPKNKFDRVFDGSSNFQSIHIHFVFLCVVL